MNQGHGRAQRIQAHEPSSVTDEVLQQGRELDPLQTENGAIQRGILQNAFVGPGRFGKMFPDLERFEPDPGALEALGSAMQEIDPTLQQANSSIPAGFTYLGQFIDHDITFDQTVGFPRIEDEATIVQARTSSLDLDSLYGLGPKFQPELYDPTTTRPEKRFAIGRTAPHSSAGGAAPGTPAVPGGTPHDLPRSPDGRAIIADPRNDENLIVAQLHLAFLKFHNKVLDFIPGAAGEENSDDTGYTVSEDHSKRTRFHRSRRKVRWHYQWLVLNDFLPRLVDPDVLDDVRQNGRKFFKFPDGELFMPVEFSVAAYRMGHSMIRESYNYNRVFASRTAEPNALTEATLGLLFQFTGRGGGAPIPGNWVIDWRRFFEIDDPALLDPARRIDPYLAPQLHKLPMFTQPEPSSLAVRNLMRGRSLGLAHGQAVAEAVGATPLTRAELTSGPEGPVVKEHEFDQRTPLWYYVLKEAELQHNGERLGQVGSRIVAELFYGLADGHPDSFRRRQPDWTPDLPGATAGHFTIVDLLRFVGEVNPIG